MYVGRRTVLSVRSRSSRLLALEPPDGLYVGRLYLTEDRTLAICHVPSAWAAGLPRCVRDGNTLPHAFQVSTCVRCSLHAALHRLSHSMTAADPEGGGWMKYEV